MVLAIAVVDLLRVEVRVLRVALDAVATPRVKPSFLPPFFAGVVPEPEAVEADAPPVEAACAEAEPNRPLPPAVLLMPKRPRFIMLAGVTGTRGC